VNATGVTAGPAESNGSLLQGVWRDSLHVTCGLTACTPGSAPGPTLGNEYGKTCPLSKNDRDADISSTSFLATQSTHAIVSKIRQQQFMGKFSRT